MTYRTQNLPRHQRQTCDSIIEQDSLQLGRFTMKHIFKTILLAAVLALLAMTSQTASAAQPAGARPHHRHHGRRGHAGSHPHAQHHTGSRTQ